MALLVLAAWILRIGVGLTRHPLEPVGDEPEYVSLAVTLLETGQFRVGDHYQELFQGGEPGDFTAYRSPALPAFLAAHFALFGEGLTAPRLTLTLLGAATAGILVLMGIGLGYPLAGWISGAAWAVWPPAVLGPYAADRVYPETLGIFLLLSSLLALVAARRRGQGAWWVGAGLVMGLAALTRGYLVLLVPMVALWALWLGAEGGRWKAAGLFLVAALVIPGSWMARNQAVMGAPVLTTQTEALYLGNNAWARGSFYGDFYEVGRAAPQLQAVEERHPGAWTASELERSRIWTREGVRSLLDSPKRAAWLMMRKSLVLWAPLQFWRVPGYGIHWLYLLALPLAALGFYYLIMAGERRTAALVVLPILAVWAAVLMTYAMDRYRYVAEPLILLLAGVGVMALLRAVKRRTRG